MGDKPGTLVVVGLGYRPGHLTTEAIAWISAADKVLYLSIGQLGDAVMSHLNPSCSESLKRFYDLGKERGRTYAEIVDYVLSFVRAGQRTCVAFYGHPGVFVYPTHEAIRRARAEGFHAVMMPGVSAEDCLIADLGIDLGVTGYQAYEATRFLRRGRAPDQTAALILWQVGMLGISANAPGRYAGGVLPQLVDALCCTYPSTHQVVLYEAAMHLDCPPRITRCQLSMMAEETISTATTLFIPPLRVSSPSPHGDAAARAAHSGAEQ